MRQQLLSNVIFGSMQLDFKTQNLGIWDLDSTPIRCQPGNVQLKYNFPIFDACGWAVV